MQWSSRQCCMPQACGHPALQKIFGKFQVADTKANSLQLFKQLSWALFYDEAKINKSVLVYKRISGDCPSCMAQVVIRNADVDEQTSRHEQLNLVYPRCKRESERGRSFTVSTIRLQNKIPSEIRNKQNLICFQKSMLEHFLKSYNDLDYLSCNFN